MELSTPNIDKSQFMSQSINGEAMIDVSDKKVWKLVLSISTKGFKAYYLNVSTNEIVLHIDKTWDCDESEMLHRLQETIYEHQSLLTEHPTTAIIESRHFALAPKEIVNLEEDAELILEQVHPLNWEDLWIDTIKDVTVVFSLAKGLDSFLHRTFIIDKVISHFNPLLIKAFQANTNKQKMLINLRDGRIDIVAVADEKLLLANTFDWQDCADASYHTLNVWNILEFDQKNAELHIYGNKELRDAVIPALKKFITFVIPQNESIDSLIASAITNKQS